MCLGFAGVGNEKVLSEEIGLASKVLGNRYDFDARSLSLINDERDLERGPLATVVLRPSAMPAAGFDDDFSFLLVEIVGPCLSFQAVSRTWQVVDSGMLHRPVSTRAERSGASAR